MRWSILLMALACGPLPSAEAAEKPKPKPGLGIEVEVLAEKRTLAVRLVNNSNEPLTVLTQRFTFRGVEDRGFHWEVVLGLPDVTRHKGRVVAPALGTYGPVKLMPGEVTEPIVIRLEALYKAVPVKPLGTPWGETRVVYEVHPFWGKRLNLFQGKVTQKVQGVTPDG
jgi:hypothetical protein